MNSVQSHTLGMPYIMALTPDAEKIGLELRKARKEARHSVSQAASLAEVSMSLIGAIERGDHLVSKVAPSRLVKFPAAYGISAGDFYRLTGVAVAPVETESRLSESQRWAQTQALEDARDDARPGSWEPVYGTGFGPAVSDEEPEGEVWIDEETKRRYPGLIFNRIKGTCLEPDYPDNWIACIVPDPGLATSGSPVLVWWAGNGRVVKYLIESREDGDHKLYQPNPAEGETKTLYAPVGSQILGVVVDVRRGGSKKASMREMVEAIADERPDWLEEDL